MVSGSDGFSPPSTAERSEIIDKDPLVGKLGMTLLTFLSRKNTEYVFFMEGFQRK